jgi:hypothetical protein
MAIRFAEAVDFIAEPPPSSDYTGGSRQEQLARILYRLCDELHGRLPRLRMPSRQMVDCLVYNGIDEDVLNSEDLNGQILALLKTIRKRTQAQLELAYCFRRRDGVTPLFPSEEPFDEWDTFRLCQVLIQHLEQQLPRGDSEGW